MIKKYNEFLNEGSVLSRERIKLIDDEFYLLVVPLTDKASCKYGAFTGWCTAVPHSGASLEDIGVNQSETDYKLLYIINKKYNENILSGEFAYLYKQREEGDITDDEFYEKTDDIDDVDKFDLEKIAIEYTNKRGYTIWDKNNLNMTNFNMDLYELGLDEYIIEAIEKYCEEYD